MSYYDEKNHLLNMATMVGAGILGGPAAAFGVWANTGKQMLEAEKAERRHRGTKNITEFPRYMIGTSYSISWYKLGFLKFKKECEEVLLNAPFSTFNIEYI